MEEIDLAASEENCPMCAHHCPLTATSCRRGNDYAYWVYEQKMKLLEQQELQQNPHPSEK